MRWGRIRMIAIVSILPLLFLVIWLFTVKMPGPAFSGPLPPLTPNQALIRSALERHVRALAHDMGVLELARTFAHERQARTVRFVFFPNEEPPSFPTANMGSRHYATAARARNDQIVAMLSIESIGYYDTEKGSQRYPFPLNLAYPNVGDFIGFVSNLSSRALLHRAIAAFRAHATLPTQGAAAPSWVPGVWWSDHWSFWREGYPAIMIPDTAPYRYPFYHTPQDTPDKVDYDRMARVVHGLTRVVRAIAN